MRQILVKGGDIIHRKKVATKKEKIIKAAKITGIAVVSIAILAGIGYVIYKAGFDEGAEFGYGLGRDDADLLYS